MSPELEAQTQRIEDLIADALYAVERANMALDAAPIRRPKTVPTETLSPPDEEASHG